MKKTEERPDAVKKSLAAIQAISCNADIRQGLANTIAALVSGEISADDGLAIVKAVKKRTREIRREALKGGGK